MQGEGELTYKHKHSVLSAKREVFLWNNSDVKEGIIDYTLGVCWDGKVGGVKLRKVSQKNM